MKKKAALPCLILTLILAMLPLGSASATPSCFSGEFVGTRFVDAQLFFNNCGQQGYLVGIGYYRVDANNVLLETWSDYECVGPQAITKIGEEFLDTDGSSIRILTYGGVGYC